MTRIIGARPGAVWPFSDIGAAPLHGSRGRYDRAVRPLVPARLAFGPGGAPYSEAYGDVYHSADGGLAQARHVFLGGNGLPARWRERASFTIVETGFGLGLN